VANPRHNTSEAETSLTLTNYEDLVYDIPVDLKISSDKLQFGEKIGEGQRTN
jgi:hypothetical protein